jgi:hypothetical protein
MEAIQNAAAWDRQSGPSNRWALCASTLLFLGIGFILGRFPSVIGTAFPSMESYDRLVEHGDAVLFRSFCRAFEGPFGSLWRNGRRIGLKIQGPVIRSCGFDPHQRHLRPLCGRSLLWPLFTWADGVASCLWGSFGETGRAVSWDGV